MYKYLCTYLYVFMCIYMCVLMYVCVNVWVCECVHVCLCICSVLLATENTSIIYFIKNNGIIKNDSKNNKCVSYFQK